MLADIHTTLSWLPSAPENFRQKLREAAASDQPGALLRQLANCSLNLDQLNSLARAVHKAAKSPANFGALTPYKLGIVANSTTEHLAPAITATGLRHGLLVEVVLAPYGQLMQAAAGAVAELCDADLDSVLCATDGLAFPSAPGLFDPASTNSASIAVSYLRELSDGISSHCGAPCILQTLASQPEFAFGSLDREIVGTHRHFTDEFNKYLADLTGDSKHLLLDVGHMAETIGTANWHDPKLYAMAKISFSLDYVPFYADQLCRLLAAQKGKSRRCLILDLDDTLWGGVIGDDGLSGIQLGQGSPSGEAYLTVQRTALALRQRGVVLAVSSKNDDTIAREPFRDHPDMLLREEHIAVFKANWENKATNISRISSELGLGLDAFVFLDNNSMERALVRQELPEVAVPELPEDPAFYSRTLLAAGYFESIHYSAEDGKRADDYQARAKRQEVQQTAVDMDAFLKTLDMHATIAPFQPDSIKRITQLVNKSNQFNLTTRRYSETEIDSISRDSQYRTRQIRLADTFGDNGLISVIIVAINGDTWEIDTWLMSCRVLGRRVEELALKELVNDAKVAGATLIKGTYAPTARNKLVANHYASLGFSHTDEQQADENASSTWQLLVDDYKGAELPFVVTRS